jgi:hypothetical protein
MTPECGKYLTLLRQCAKNAGNLQALTSQWSKNAEILCH